MQDVNSIYSLHKLILNRCPKYVMSYWLNIQFVLILITRVGFDTLQKAAVRSFNLMNHKLESLTYQFLRCAISDN